MSRTVVVTGAGSGIGKATSALLSAQDCNVIGVDLRNADIIADLSTPEGRWNMVEAVESKSGGAIDAVIACAGLAIPQAITVAVNYFGAINTLDGLRPLLSKGNQPRAVAISSLASLFDHDQALVEACLSRDETGARKIASVLEKDPAQSGKIYASTKKALAQWVRRSAVSSAWAGAGIPLNAVAPGLIATPMTQAMIDDKPTMEGMTQMMPMPLGRYGQPEEVAQLLAFLASPANSLMVGQVMFIDAGSEATTRGDSIW